MLAGLAGPRMAQAEPPRQEGTPIRYGETVSGEISDDAPCQVYVFEGAAGDPITIDMTRTSGSLDGVLALYAGDDLEAEPVAFSDDRPGGGLNPLIETTLPAGGKYTITACRLQNENMRVTVGTFDLTLSGPEAEMAAGESDGVMEEPGGAEPVPTTTNLTGELLPGTGSATPTPGSSGSLTSGLLPAAPQEAAQAEIPLIAYGDVVEGRLDDATAEAVYTLEVEEGDTVSLEWSATSGEIAPKIGIYDAEGNLIAAAGSQEAITHLELIFVAPADEALTVRVIPYDAEGGAGTFEFAVTQVE
jgi:hypothetical protein